jgi:amino acid transporter
VRDLHKIIRASSPQISGVDASRVVFAFARDGALPGSRWWKQINHNTQTPVNAVWFVMAGSAICGLLGFSSAALSSLAGYVILPYISEYADHEIELP